MQKKQRNRLWNFLIVLTLAVCVFAFVMHYKNWTKIKDGQLQVLSGIYMKRISLSEIDSISYVKRLPEMERKNGFSWMAKEKGVFKDSLTQSKVYVFVDDLRKQKIRLVYNDSLKMFFNLSDSLKTQVLFEQLDAKILINNNPE